jgi:hypothetical protein
MVPGLGAARDQWQIGFGVILGSIGTRMHVTASHRFARHGMVGVH